MAEYYDDLYDPRRVARAYPFLIALFRRLGPIRSVLDVGCGTFAIDLPLLRRGYEVVGRDVSPAMLRVAREKLPSARLHADVAQGDIRELRLGRTFDAILCLGTFNYFTSAADVGRAFGVCRRHLRPGGLLVLDLTNFDAWLRDPMNARTEVDHRAADGTRIAIFGYNEQTRSRSIHVARFLTVLQRGDRIDLGFDEAPLRVWTREALAKALAKNGFRPVEWWGDLRLGLRFSRTKSPRLVSVSVRE